MTIEFFWFKRFSIQPWYWSLTSGIAKSMVQKLCPSCMSCGASVELATISWSPHPSLDWYPRIVSPTDQCHALFGKRSYAHLTGSDQNMDNSELALTSSKSQTRGLQSTKGSSRSDLLWGPTRPHLTRYGPLPYSRPAHDPPNPPHLLMGYQLPQPHACPSQST